MEMKTHGNQEFFPNDVLEILKKGPATRQAIADSLECSMHTVYRLVVKLIEDGNDIGFNGSGYFLLVKDDLDKNDEERGKTWTTKMYGMLIRLVKRAEAHVPVAKQIRSRIGQELTSDERKMFKKELLLLVRVVDAADLDEELGE
jgi:biotin operon repressor